VKIARICHQFARNKNKDTKKGRHNEREKNVKRNNQESKNKLSFVSPGPCGRGAFNSILFFAFYLLSERLKV